MAKSRTPRTVFGERVTPSRPDRNAPTPAVFGTRWERKNTRSGSWEGFDNPPPDDSPTNTALPSIMSADYNVGTVATISLGTWTGATSLAGSLRHVSDDTEVATFTEDGTYQIADTDFGESLYLHVTAQPGDVAAESAAVGPVDFAYLLRVEFDTADAAPLTSPYVGETGSLTIADAGNIMSAAGGELVTNGTASGNTGYYSGAISRAAGRAFLWRINELTAGGLSRIGRGSSGAVSSALTGGFLLTSTTVFSAFPGSYAVVPGSLPGNVLMILRPDAGWFYVHDQTLRFVSVAGTDATEYAKQWTGSGQAPNFKTERLVVFDLGAAGLATQYGMATAHVETPSDGEVITHTADGLIETLWTPAASETFILRFRRTDDDNCYRIEANQAGGSWRIYRRQAGVDSDLTTAIAATMTAGVQLRVFVSAIGNTIKAHLGPAAATGSVSATLTQTFNNTATGAKLSGFATAAHFTSWPTDWSGIVPETYNEYHPYFLFGDSKAYIPLNGLSSVANGAWLAQPEMLRTGGTHVAYWAANIDAALAGRTEQPEFIFITLGVNDSPSNVDTEGEQTTWLTNAAYILDALHTAYPAAHIIWTLPGKRGAEYQATLDIICDTLIPAAISGRDYAHLGPDDRDWCENGDDYATYTYDGLHYNAAGEAAKAALCLTAAQALL